MAYRTPRKTKQNSRNVISRLFKPQERFCNIEVFPFQTYLLRLTPAHPILDLPDQLAHEQDPVYEDPVGGPLDLEVAEECVGAEEGENLVERVVGLVGCIDCEGVDGGVGGESGELEGGAAGVGAEGEEGEVSW